MDETLGPESHATSGIELLLDDIALPSDKNDALFIPESEQIRQ